MAYDEAAKKWKIADAKSLFDVVTGPCVNTDLPENYGVFLNPLLDVLANKNRDDFRKVCSGYDFVEFYSYYYTENDILAEYFKRCSIEIVEEHVNAEKGEVVVDVKLIMPDLAAMDRKLMSDHDRACELFELYIMNLLEGNTRDNTMIKVMDVYKAPLIEALKANDIPMTTVEGSFTLLKNVMTEGNQQDFMITAVPEKLLYEPNIFMFIDADLGASYYTETVNKIVEEGVATREEIDAAFERSNPES